MATPEYTLGVWDYVILVGLLLVSAAIGVFHALRGGKQKDSKEYFLGNRKMGAFPVSMSIIVSVMSAVTYIGTPAEVYRHGPMYWLMSVNKIVGAGLVTTCFLPVFYNLEITSVYEYIDMRFNKFVRYGVILADCSYTFIYMGIVMYTPALALSTVTGITLTGSILAIGLVCTFYTAIGGIKAVIWTDVLQVSAFTFIVVYRVAFITFYCYRVRKTFLLCYLYLIPIEYCHSEYAHQYCIHPSFLPPPSSQTFTYN